MIFDFSKYCLLVLILGFLGSNIFAQDEFKEKRESNFEFASEPKVYKNENHYEISFETKSFCDVTVAIEDLDGKIVRHLISGVLGNNAPQPFIKNSLKQKIIWDGKNDQENYLDNLENYRIRVSLGLKPQFEKTLYWSSNRRIEKRKPLLAPTPEGMVVYEGGQAMDFVKLYNHEGGYQKTLYPFPADKIKNAQGLIWHTFPHDGKPLPIKGNFLQNTMLTSGDNAVPTTYKVDKKAFESVGSKYPQHYGMSGTAATCIASHKSKLALIYRKINRLSLEGDTAGMPLNGSQTSLVASDRTREAERPTIEVGPTSSAFSPDGEWLYMTGYTWTVFMQNGGYWQEWLNCVTRVKYDGSGKLEILIGNDKLDDFGKENSKFSVPTSLQIDSKGNLYVTDYMNDRIQVFTLDGKYIRSINIAKPVNLVIDEKKNEFYVSSWFIKSTHKEDFSVKKPVLYKYENIENPKLIQSYDLSFNDYIGAPNQYDSIGGMQYNVVIDIHGINPKVWVVSGAPRFIPANELGNQISPWVKNGIKIYSIGSDKLILEKDFGKEASAELARLTPPLYYRQKLYVNPKTEFLYLWEGQNEDGTGAGKGSQELVEFNPKTGESKLVPLPFDAEDIVFDTNGMIYLKSRGVVARFQMDGMKEIPWDYGSEESQVGFASGRMGKQKDIVSGLLIPGNLNWQHGGMFMTAKGELVVASYLGTDPTDLTKKKSIAEYKPTIFPGRATNHSHGGTYINVWDKHGKILISDAVPGLAELDGLGMDSSGGLYMMTHATRMYEGKLYYNDLSGTILKFSKGKGRVLTIGGKSIPVELKTNEAPTRPSDLKGTTGTAWVEDCEWMYGGVGYGGKNKGVGCACWTSRYTLDFFARSFAPELDRYKVAIIDANGNLIVRVGQYGNVDDGKPIDLDGGPKNTRSIGGDEVALFHGAYLATQSDKHLYIADPGNLRILKVKLGYTTEKIIPIIK